VIFEDGKESRDFIHVDDVVMATMLALEGSVSYETINVGSGKSTNVLEVVQKLQGNYNSNVKADVSGKFRLGDIRHNYADIKKMEKLLGFVPRKDFAIGLREFCEWVKTKAPENPGGYKKSLLEMSEKGLFR
jgi:dTDP-L-rhamnose 4-epimerase